MDKHIPITGSERMLLPTTRKTESIDPSEQFPITVIVRRNGVKEMPTEMHERLISEKQYQREEFENSLFIHPDDLKAIYDFTNEYDLTITEIFNSAGLVNISGSVENYSKAFRVDLANYEHANYVFRGRKGHVCIPERLSSIVQGVLGLDNRPQTKPHFQLLKANAQSANKQISYTPLEVAKLYHFPEKINCSDQCIAIIELGGGYSMSDMHHYFSNLGIETPSIIDVEVDGAKNSPTGNPNGPDGEVALDIEIVGAVAQGAKIAVYFAPNSDAGFLNAITKAIHDNVNKPSIISISWGASESQWTRQAMESINQAFKDAAALGITICCAAGDNGSSDGIEDGLAHVDFPASSPYVLACGGTRLVGSEGEIVQEIVWNESGNGATGGGISSVFPLPYWQENRLGGMENQINGRGVPDISGNADPMTGYEILVNGRQYDFGGTSAVAPLYAGLFANINQELGKSIGYVNPIFYQYSGAEFGFRDVTVGNNDTIGKGDYEAKIGWDACTGLGSIDGLKAVACTKIKQCIKSCFVKTTMRQKRFVPPSAFFSLSILYRFLYSQPFIS